MNTFTPPICLHPSHVCVRVGPLNTLDTYRTNIYARINDIVDSSVSVTVRSSAGCCGAATPNHEDIRAHLYAVVPTLTADIVWLAHTPAREYQYYNITVAVVNR